MVLSLLITILIQYCYIHTNIFITAILWTAISYKRKKELKLLLFFIICYNYGHIITEQLQHNFIRKFLLNRALQIEPSGSMQALLLAYTANHWMSYKYILQNSGLMHSWVASGYHLHIVKKYLKYMPYSKILLSIYVWIICSGSIPIVRAWLNNIIKVKNTNKRLLWTWYYLLCIYPQHSLHPSLCLSLWISFWISHNPYKNSLLFSMRTWGGMIFPCLYYGIPVHPWGWLMDYLWTRWITHLIFPSMWVILLIGPGSISSIWNYHLHNWFSRLQILSHIISYRMITSDQIVLLFICAVLLIYSRHKTICLICALYALYIKQETYLHAFDVQKGQSLLFVHNNYAILIDSGNKKYSKKIAKYLIKYGIFLDAILISHDDQDHIGGLTDLRGFLKNPSHVWLPGGSKAFKSPIQNYVYKTKECIKGQQLHYGEYKFTVLHPDRKHYGKNDQSCVWLLSGPNNWVFPGDISEKIETKLLAENIRNVDGLVLAHHGSQYSNSSVWLAHLNPKHIIISSNKNTLKKNHKTLTKISKIPRLKKWHSTIDGDVTIKLQYPQLNEDDVDNPLT